MLNKFTFSVTRLNEYANSVLSNDVRLRALRVEGEISGLKRYSSGHLYFTLKDESSSVRCVMFNSNVVGLKIEPCEGKRVVLTACVSIYPRDGQFQLNVTAMKEVGDGELHNRFLETKALLNSEGLFNQNRQLPLLPRCIGVITSSDGAAYHDIITCIQRRFPAMAVRFIHSTVQGINAPAELIRAIEQMNQATDVDVIIIARGGGSYEDLSCFNDESFARALFASRIPTVCGVGHEVDFTIADFVADLRAPTPTAAAELCVPDYQELLHRLCTAHKRLVSAMKSKLCIEDANLRLSIGASKLGGVKNVLSSSIQKLNGDIASLRTLIQELIASKSARTDSTAVALQALNPHAVLKRGYAMVVCDGGEYLSSVSEIAVGQSLGLIMSEGSAKVRVETIKVESTQ